MLEVRFFIKDHMDVPEVIMTWERGRLTSRRWKLVIDQAFFMACTYGIDADLMVIEIRRDKKLLHVITTSTVQFFARIYLNIWIRSELYRSMNIAE